jgi:hypothetical protein
MAMLASRRMIGAFAVALLLVTAPTAISSTHRQKVDPFAAGWTVAAKASGYCDSTAESTKRSDAFRCYRGSYRIIDPCFSSPSASGAVRCVEEPWTRKAIEVQLTKPLPASAPGGEQVWAVALANGERCAIWPENTEKSFGHVIGWTCTNGELAQGLHSGKTWWALWQPSNGAPWTHVSIRTLYR